MFGNNHIKRLHIVLKHIHALSEMNQDIAQELSIMSENPNKAGECIYRMKNTIKNSHMFFHAIIKDIKMETIQDELLRKDLDQLRHSVQIFERVVHNLMTEAEREHLNIDRKFLISLNEANKISENIRDEEDKIEHDEAA